MGKMTDANIWWEKYDEKRPLERPMRTWDNIKIPSIGCAVEASPHGNVSSGPLSDQRILKDSAT